LTVYTVYSQFNTLIIMVKQIENDAEFEEFAKGTVIVDFTASWCPPCQMIGI